MPSPVSIFFSLRTKFMLFACTLVLLCALIWGGWTWFHERKMLQSQLEDAGSVLVSSMAIPIINALLYEELGLVSEGGLLDNFIIDIMENPQLSPVYAVVTDTGGKILAHSEISRYGEQLDDDLNQRVVDAADVVLQRYEWQGQAMLDIGSPLAIHGKRWGALRIGLPLAPLQGQLERLAFRIVSFSTLFVLGAILIVFVAGSRLVSPLKNLAVIMANVDGDQLAKVPESSRRDELGLLQNNFSGMLKRLRKSERERDKSLKTLLENERLVTAGRMAAGVAHEINNPLAGIDGALEILKRKPEALEHYLPLLQEEVSRVSSMVSQMLDLSRAGDLDKHVIESHRFVEDCLNICRLALKKQQVEVNLILPVPELVLRCDHRKLQQVVLNLAINAADAMDNKGQINLSATVDGNAFIVRISDEGPGIPEHLQEQIFTPFFTTKAAGKGTGIGLAFCQSIVEKHGGTLRIINVPSGACFEIRIPPS